MLAEDPRYYEMDSRRLTLRECWRLSPGPGFVILVLLKIARIRVPSRVAVAFPERLVLGDPSEVDQGGRSGRLSRLIAPLDAGGFRFRFLHKPLVINPDGSAVQLLYLSEDRRSWAALSDAEAHKMGLTMRRTTLALGSPLSGGRFLITTNETKSTDAPSNYLVERMKTGKADKVLARHRRRLESLEGSSAEPIAEDGLEDLALTVERQDFQFQVDRGLYRPMTPRQVHKLRQARPQAGGTMLSKLARVWMLWPLIAGVSFLVSLLATGRAPFDEAFGEETPYALSCPVESAPEPASAAASREVQRATLVGLFADEAAAERAVAELAGGGEDRIVRRVARVVLAQAADGSTAGLEPMAGELDRLGADTMLDAADFRWGVLFHLRWRAETEEARAATAALRHYLGAPANLYLTPPWAAGGVLDASRSAARAAFYHLYRSEVPGGWSGLREALADLWALRRATGSEDGGFDSYNRRVMERLERRVDELVVENDAVDRVTADLYLAWQRSFYAVSSQRDPWTEAEATGAGGQSALRALGRHLGRLDVDDEARRAAVPNGAGHRTGASGWGPVDLGGDGVGTSYLSFADAASGLPALVTYLCDAGAESLALGLEGEPVSGPAPSIGTE